MCELNQLNKGIRWPEKRNPTMGFHIKKKEKNKCSPEC